jgi:hypothetical protein
MIAIVGRIGIFDFFRLIFAHRPECPLRALLLLASVEQLHTLQ